jgi:hypothetical protein
MSQYKDETPLAFLYRLNLGAEHAGVRFRKSDRSRDQHVKRFLKNLHDDQLKLTLQTQRFRKVSDWEYILKQQEEVRGGGRQNRAPQARDFRADNVIRDRYKPKRNDRAYVAQNDEAKSVEVEEHPEAAVDIQDDQVSDIPDGNPICDTMTREELIHEVYRIMGNVGWPYQRANPNGNPGQPPPRPFPPRDNPDRNELCEDCGKWGHKADNCFQTRICGRCNRRGHLKEECRTNPCPKCKQYHDGRCEDWKAFQDLRKMIDQGDLPDLPSHIRDAILGGKVPSGEDQLNH